MEKGVTVIEKWKKAVDKDRSFCALQTHFLKAFDGLPHEELVAKIHAHGFSLSFRLIHSYSSNRKPNSEVN